MVIALDRWFSQYAEDNNALLSKLEVERDQRLSEIDKKYQERMVEVNERYEHELGVIASKYQLLRESPNGLEAG